MWWVLVQPYARYFDIIERNSYTNEFMFSLLIALAFMTSSWVRALMVLFLPSLIGNATQNYIIVMLFVAIFTNPISNVALNAVESVRVIGCSLTMTFEQLRERAKLVLNPVFEVLNDSDQSDILPIRQELAEIQQLIIDMRREAEFNRNINVSTGAFVQPIDTNPDDMLRDLGKRVKADPETTRELVNKTRQLINDATLEFDRSNLGVKASIDLQAMRQFIKDGAHGSLGEFNLTQIMFENCLGIFRRAKLNCEEAVEDMRKSCRDTIGTFLSALWCSPISFTISSMCPFIMNQIVDENNLCKQMQQYISNVKLSGLNVSSEGDVNESYKNLMQQAVELGDDFLGSGELESPQRLELSISFNNQTRSIFSKGINLMNFITDKYRIRKALIEFLLFLYEVYTTITFIFIIRQAYLYHKNYKSDIRFDNHYITGQLVALDQHRRERGKATILPLTKDESKEYITTFTCKRRTSEERKTQRASCITVLIFLAFVTSLLYFDDLFYSILDSIQDHALVRYKEVGHHELDVKVKGDGAIARLVRRLTSRLSSVYDLNKLTSTKDCLPQPLATSGRFYLELVYLVIVYVFVDQISIYAMRLRRITAAFFYPVKERQRIGYLYRMILLRRQEYKDTGLTSYIDEGKEADRDTSIFTLKDAILYLNNCVSDSLNCCRHSR